MTVVKELIRSELDGTLSFGDYTLDTKTKKDGFEFQGDIYKVKTFKEITKLEKNGMFVYESVPGTAVEHFEVSEDVISFKVSGTGDAQITLTATITSGNVSDTKEFQVTVKKNLTAKEIVALDLEEMDLGNLSAVSEDLKKVGQ